MPTRSPHRRVRPLMTRRVAAIAICLASVYLMMLTSQRALDAYRITAEVDAVRREILALRTRNSDLQAELSSGRSDEDIERIAREDLGFVKPGDHAVILLWPNRDSPGAAPRTLEEAGAPNWREWFRLFVDLDYPAIDAER